MKMKILIIITFIKKKVFNLIKTVTDKNDGYQVIFIVRLGK